MGGGGGVRWWHRGWWGGCGGAGVGWGVVGWVGGRVHGVLVRDVVGGGMGDGVLSGW